MTFALVRAELRYRVPRAAILAAATLVALGVVAAATPQHERGPVICPFRAVTGLPCPTCGMIRAAGHVLRGELTAAYRTNPFDAAAMTVAAPLLLLLWAMNAAGGWVLRIDARPRERAATWVLAAIVLLVNWAYVLTTQL